MGICKDILKLYDLGYSLDYLVKLYYNFKIKDDVPNHDFNGNYIITKKSYNMNMARRDVENLILNRNKK